MPPSNSVKRARTDRDFFKEKTPKKADKAPARAEILTGEHSRYQVKSGWLSGTFVARAFPKPPTEARGLIAEATGATEEAAIAALHELIDARENRRTEDRRADAESGVAVPSVEEYVEALRQIALSGPQRAMLGALALAGEEGLTEARMTRAAGYKSLASAHRSFLAIGLLIADYLAVAPDEGETAPSQAAETLLGLRVEAGDGAAPCWVLHAELRDAVRRTI